jgi:hypothetical protein
VVSNWHHGLGIRMQVAGSANVGALHGTEFMGIMVVGLVIDLHRGERWYYSKVHILLLPKCNDEHILQLQKDFLLHE